LFVEELTAVLPVNVSAATVPVDANDVDQLPLVLQRLSAPPPVHV